MSEAPIGDTLAKIRQAIGPPAPAGLTDGETAILNEALKAGFYVASGRRICLLVAFEDRCKASGKPAVVIFNTTRKAKVNVNGAQKWEGKHNEAEGVARRIAEGGTA